MSEFPRRSFLWPVRLPRGESGEGQTPPERLRVRRFRIGVTFAIAAGVNLILLAAYLWSRGGQTTHVTVEANGDQYVATIDGRVHAEARLPGPQQGGIIILFGSTEGIPSLPKPRGLDSIKVTDATSGQTLFEDDFSHGVGAPWKVGGAPVVRDGVVGSRGDVSLTLPENWTDYVVHATFRNFQAGAIMVRAQSQQDGVSYTFRPYRDYDNAFALVQAGKSGQSKLGGPIALSRTESVKALVSMVLRFYPYAFVLLALGFFVVLGIQLASTYGMPKLGEIWSDQVAFALTGGLAVFGFVTTLFLNYSYGSHLPHVPDELSYLFQAKLLSAGHLTAPLPPVQSAFDYFYPPFIIATHGHWAGVYPFGHPLLLAIGVRFGVPWIIPPIVGALSVVLLFLIGRKVYSARVGALAALLFVASPFYLMTASNFMSHNTAAFYLLGVLACIVYAERRPVLLGALGGLAFGLLFNTQALTAVVLVVPIGLLLLSELLPEERRRMGRTFYMSFVAAGAVMLVAYFLYNRGVTGDAFTSALSDTSGKYLGFGGQNSPGLGIQNQGLQMSFLLLVLNGWPLLIGLGFVLLPFALGTRERWDWFLLVAIVCALGVYVLYIGGGIMHGPRYWYVVSPLLMLLSARGAERAGEVLSAAADRVRAIIIPSRAGAGWAGMLVVYVFVAALAGTSAYNWLLGHNRTWSDVFVPAQASDLKGFNSIDDRLIKLIDDAHLHNALVLVADDCEGWQCYGSVFLRNKPTLDGDVVYARDVADRRGDLFKAYPDRLVYFAHYGPPAYLSIYGSTQALAQIPAATPPRARDITLPTPTATATPDPAEAGLRDDQRKRDLDAIAGALQEYYARHGGYPTADGVQSFCRYKELDSGCKVSEVLDPVPQDPQSGQTYYYWSNGTSFYLFAVTETPAGPSQCDTAPLKPGQDHLYCLYGTTEPGATPPPLATPTPASGDTSAPLLTPTPAP